MKLYPAPAFLLVEILKSETTSNGIYTGEAGKNAPILAKVLKIGIAKAESTTNPLFVPAFEVTPDKYTDLKEDDLIYFIRGGDRPLPDENGKKLSFLPFEHVLSLCIKEDKE